MATAPREDLPTSQKPHLRVCKARICWLVTPVWITGHGEQPGGAAPFRILCAKVPSLSVLDKSALQSKGSSLCTTLTSERCCVSSLASK